MEFKSISDLGDDIYERLLPQLPRDVGIVYGIPRSGMLPATMIATALGARLGVVGGNLNFGERQLNLILPKREAVLLVDDSIHTGRALTQALKEISGFKGEIYTCAIYAHSKSLHLVDFHARVLDHGRFFQWNFNGIGASRNYCWDLDGVICTDPDVFDDDGPRYQDEILNKVRPLHLPHVKVKAIITNRIKKWRPETEAWLQGHGVQYEHLIMQPHKTAVERRLTSNPHEYKAREFENVGGTLFIESHDKVASLMAPLINAPVLSIESMRLFSDSKPTL